MLDRQLAVINRQKESSKIKSGCFDEMNSFVYSTSTHIKYMFLEGKTTGTFKSIDEPVYVAFVSTILFMAQLVLILLGFCLVHAQHFLRFDENGRDGDLRG